MRKQSRYEKENQNHEYDDEDDRVNMANDKEDSYSPQFKRYEAQIEELPKFNTSNYWKCDIYSEQSIDDLLNDYQ